MNTPAARSPNDAAIGRARWQRAIESFARIPKVALISVVGPFVLLVAGYLFWINYGASHLNKSLYGVLPENIVLTPQPDWIETSVLSEVFQGSELGRLSTLDRQMASTVYLAFRAHPWIRRVFNVHKFPGGVVKVNVEYREPLAMVYCEVPNKIGDGPSMSEKSTPIPASTLQSASSQKGDRKISFLPVDVDGVLLPTKDFKSDQVPKYMLIYAQSATPMGKVGGEYGDARIKEALLLCRLLKDVRESMGIERVYVYPDPASEGPSRWTLEMTTKSKKIRWGHPPGLESPGEPGFPSKLRRLGEFLLNPKSSEVAMAEFDLVVSSKPSLSNLLDTKP